MELETERRQLELDVEAKKELIARYANQQLQTRKNEEYRALTQAIEGCQEAIRQIEDRELDLMEQGEAAQREVDRLTREVAQTQAFVEDQLAGLNAREQSLKAEWDQLRQNREELAAAVEESARQRYERLIRSRGDTIVVGIQHGVCGGCHMRLPAQVIVSCRAGQELITCPAAGAFLRTWIWPLRIRPRRRMRF